MKTIGSFKHISVLLAVFLIGSTLPAFAQVGATAVPFLQIEPDSRGAGMGNTNVAIADNAAAVFWNPAGLAFQTGNEISFTHSNWLPNFNTDLFYDYLVGKYYVDGIGTIAGHITYLNLGEQQYTGPAGEDRGTFRSYEFAVGLAYGFKLTENFSLGLGTRMIYSSLVPSGLSVGAQGNANAGVSIGVDLAALYRSNPFKLGDRRAQYSLGVNLTNLGPGIQYTDEAQVDPLPTLLRAGMAFSFDLDDEGYNTLTLSGDASKIMARRDTAGNAMGPVQALFNSWDSFEFNRGNNEIINVTLADQLMLGGGMEYWYAKRFALRAGYFYESPKNGDRQFLSFGAGLRYDKFGVDFSYIYTIREEHPLANTIRFTAFVVY